MSIVVNDFVSLRNAIENSLDEEIILGADITFSSGGIDIPNTTSNLIIDGMDPITGEKHAILDYNSAAIGNTIYLSARSLAFSVTVKNIILQIRNFYGLIGVANSGLNSNVTIIYDNVDFYGIQAIYNRYGRTILKDSTFLIDRLFSSINLSGELAETNILELQGNITATHNLSSDSFIWFLNDNPKFIVSPSAVVNITINERELAYCSEPVDMSFGEDCYFNLITNHGLFYSTGNHQASSFTVGDNSTIIIKQLSRNGSVPTIRINNDLIIGNNTTFNMFVSHTNAAPLIHFLRSATLRFDNPKNVVLYNAYGGLFQRTGGSLDILTNQMNYWEVAASLGIAGTFDDLPLRRFQKIDGSDLTTNVTYSGNTVSQITSNILLDDYGYPLDMTTFNLTNCRVLSLGVLPLEVNDITDVTTFVTGFSDGSSNIRLINDSHIYNTTASSTGEFSISILGLTKGMEIEILSNKNFLYTSLFKTVIGSISMQIPNSLRFQTMGIPLNTSIIKRNEGFAIIVRDSRDLGSDYKIYAYILEQLHSSLDIIDDAVIYKDNSIENILNINPTLIYEGVGNTQDITITTITWEEIEGLLLKMSPVEIYNPGVYQTVVYWILITN